MVDALKFVYTDLTHDTAEKGKRGQPKKGSANEFKNLRLTFLFWIGSFSAWLELFELNIPVRDTI
jgi:hypothetical protein